MENWKEIKSYEGKYQASNNGKIRSLNYRNQKGIIKEMTPSISNKGYLMFPLPLNKKQKSFCVHRIIAETFLELPLDYENVRYTVNHKDGNKLNNNISNLEWMTYSENNKHSYQILGKVSGMKGNKFEKSKLSKKVTAYSDDMTFVKTYNSTTEAFSKDGYTSSGISQAVKNKNKYKKLNWKYE
jgi:hypothetical protein|tara:strand:+ start:999 stop:1550 length:552 start_codon:yes stop_codon:yes gene_type:complete